MAAAAAKRFMVSVVNGEVMLDLETDASNQRFVIPEADLTELIARLLDAQGAAAEMTGAPVRSLSVHNVLVGVDQKKQSVIASFVPAPNSRIPFRLTPTQARKLASALRESAAMAVPGTGGPHRH